MIHSSILHVDGDNFFAELVRQKKPRLKHRPIIIGHLKSRGAVVAASYEARHAGVQPGITMQQARRVCPDAVLEQIDWESIGKATRELHRLLGKYSPAVEPLGADAAFLDYTGCQPLFGPAVDFARKLQRTVTDHMGISVSVGLSPDKAVSAVACRAAKLASFQSVDPGQEALFLAECPLIWLPGIDAQLSHYFNQLGMRLIGDLARVPTELLEHLLGKLGSRLSLRAKGLEHAVVRPPAIREDPDTMEDFSEDRIHPGDILSRLAVLSSALGRALRSNHQEARTLKLTIEHIDGRVLNRQKHLRPSTHRDPELFAASRQLFEGLYTRRVRVRRIRLKAVHVGYSLPELPFGDAEHRIKWNRVLAAADKARQKFSQNAVQIGASLESVGETEAMRLIPD